MMTRCSARLDRKPSRNTLQAAWIRAALRSVPKASLPIGEDCSAVGYMQQYKFVAYLWHQFCWSGQPSCLSAAVKLLLQLTCACWAPQAARQHTASGMLLEKAMHVCSHTLYLARSYAIALTPACWAGIRRTALPAEYRGHCLAIQREQDRGNATCAGASSVPPPVR